MSRPAEQSRQRTRGGPSPAVGRGSAGEQQAAVGAAVPMATHAGECNCMCKAGGVSSWQLGAVLCHTAEGGSRAVNHPWVPGLQGTASAETCTSYCRVLRPSPTPHG